MCNNYLLIICLQKYGFLQIYATILLKIHLFRFVFKK